MTDERRGIPLIVGVTGHRDLREEDSERLRKTVKQELASLEKQLPHTRMILLCSLAAGGDLLCAEAAEEMGIPLYASLPMEAELYQADFDEADRERLNRQLARAERIFTVTPAEEGPETETPEYRYRQAGIYVAEHSHILLALWDGEADRSGCGTAAAVGFALSGDWLPARGSATRNGDNAGVIHIPAGRSGTEVGEPAPARRLGKPERMDEILRKTDEFNDLAARKTNGGGKLLPESAAEDEALAQMEALYVAADGLSLHYAKIYRRLLGTLALAGTLLTLFFLLYDEGGMNAMILLCGAVLILAGAAQRLAARTQCHRRYTEYRALAEALRTQAYLRYAGSRTEVQRLMTWSQQRENSWILCAMSGLNAAEAPREVREIRDCWVEAQRAYHEAAGKRTGIRKERSDRVVSAAAGISAVLYLVLLLYELIWGGLIFPPAGGIRNPETGRTLMKVILGTISAGTLFINSYHGKMSLGRKMEDHEKLERFYARAAERLDRWGQRENLLEEIARDELEENANWCSYQRDNAPEINI